MYHSVLTFSYQIFTKEWLSLNNFFNQSINQSMDGWMDRWMDQSIDRLINQSISQSMYADYPIRIERWLFLISDWIVRVHQECEYYIN